MYCIHCGKKIDNGAKYCVHCGKPQDAVPGAGDDATTVLGADPTVQAAPASGTAAPAGGTAPAPEPSATPDQTVGYQAYPQPDAARAASAQKSRAVPIAIAVACVAAAAILVAVFAVPALTGSTGSDVQPAASPEPPAEASDEPAELRFSISKIDASAFPAVSLTLTAKDGEGNVPSGLGIQDFVVTERDADGVSYQGVVREVAGGTDGIYKLTFDSAWTDAADQSRTAVLACAEGSEYEGEASFSYIPVQQVEEEDDDEAEPTINVTTNVNTTTPAAPPTPHIVVASDDYVLPGSDSRYIDFSEYRDFSDWELYLARNEVYARHGRRFRNDDLQRFFDGKSWYSGIYSPDEFDSMPSPFNKYEQANVDALLSYEQSIGSPYL